MAERPAWWAAVAASALLGFGMPVRAAEPGRHALVIGNATYATLPALPACRGAAAVADAMRGQGYNVTERVDANRGTLDAALGAFARKVGDAGGGTAVVYFCGYAAEFDGRLFLLPVSATLERDGDALTQGVLARSAADAAARGKPADGAVLLDLAAMPGRRIGAASLQAAEARVAEASLALVVVAGQPGTAPATPLAAALRAELPGSPAIDTPTALASVRQRLAGRSDISVLALSALPRPPPAAPAGGAAIGPASAVPAPGTPPAVGAQPTQSAVGGPMRDDSALLNESRMPEADRRRLQAALAARGFAAGRADGRFTPALRAAIRRYQASIGAEATGRLTEGQARRLLDATR